MGSGARLADRDAVGAHGQPVGGTMLTKVKNARTWWESARSVICKATFWPEGNVDLGRVNSNGIPPCPLAPYRHLFCVCV